MVYIWDERYGGKEYAFGKSPNVFFESVIDKMQPGRILVPGAGEGRDAVFAATLGWNVDAFDLSAAGSEKCMVLAKEFNTQVNYNILDAAQFKAASEEYDAVAMIYFHLPLEIRKPFHHEIIKCLKRGGKLIIEAFNPAATG